MEAADRPAVDSADAAERRKRARGGGVWKWGDVYKEKLILGLPTEVTDLQVFQDELYFIYGDLLLKCHEPDDTPETVYELKTCFRKRKRRYAVCFL